MDKIKCMALLLNYCKCMEIKINSNIVRNIK